MIGNVTRWTSSYDMLLRYQRLLPFIMLEDAPRDVRCTRLSNSENVTIDVIVRNLKRFNEATVKLQSDTLTLKDAHIYFDLLKELFVSTFEGDFRGSQVYDNILSKLDVSNAVDSVYEAGIVKLLSGDEHSLTAAEKRDLKCLRKDCLIQDGDVHVIHDSPDSFENDDALSFEELAKRRLVE